MEFSIASGTASMECQNALEDFDKSHKVAEEVRVKDCSHAPDISALLTDRQLWN